MTAHSFSIRSARTALVAAVSIMALVLPAAEAEAKKPPRVGGHVDVAWPKVGKGKPRQPLARYLALQVGALQPPKQPDQASAVADYRPLRVPNATSSSGSGSGAATITGGSATGTPLRLVRSFDIPRNDPAYDRLLNVSFTYDSALAAAAFSATRDRTQAEQLLDQLAALQRTDGSIDYAFDTLTGASDSRFWAGTIAWTGYAAEVYRDQYKSKRYEKVSEGVKSWLISQQLPNGLIKGGPTVSWASTLHNLVAWNFFTVYAANNNGKTRTEATGIANRIAAGIDANLIVDDSSGLRFEQGLDDPTEALDAQTMGIMHLLARGRSSDAGEVADYMEENFAITNSSIVTSSDPATFNETYAAEGPFTGFRPYAGTDAPDVLWMEGTLEARIALGALDRSTRTLDSSIAEWNAVTGRTVAPLMADRTLSSSYNEYHVWPVSATASWTLLGSF